jgi:hypothetical protein
MIESLEEETYSMLELLKEEDSKKTRSSATKLLVKISEAINSWHERLKQRLALNKPSSRAYLELYHGIMQADRLFELERRLKEALGVKERTQEIIDAVQRAKRPKLPIRMSGDRYKPPKRELSTKQLEFFP